MGNLIDAVFDAAPDCIFVTSEEGRIVMANGACARSFGYSVAELVGMEVEDLVPTGRRDVHRKHRNRFLKSPRPRKMAQDQRLKALRKDGTTIDVEIALNGVEVDGTYDSRRE